MSRFTKSCKPCANTQMRDGSFRRVVKNSGESGGRVPLRVMTSVETSKEAVEQ